MLSIRRMLMMEDDEEMKEWKLINDITIDEETNTLEINKDINNNNFECDEIIFFLKNIGTSNNTGSNKNAILYLSDINVGYINSIANGNGVTRIVTGDVNANPCYWHVYNINNPNDFSGGQIISNPCVGYDFTHTLEKISSIKIQLQACYFGVNSRLQVYGR